jgi:2'-hydroxyisoflavone reductase
MTWSRRHFLKSALASGAAAGALATGVLASKPAGAAFSPTKSRQSLKILILGGTAFLGPHIVEDALGRGHQVTLFNRGRTNTHLFPDLEKIKGDRDGDLEGLKDRQWDVVIDTSGYLPRLVGDSARLLADNVRQYIFISTISVFADFKTIGLDENSPVGKLEDESIEEITGLTYGPLKALCENTVIKTLPHRSCIIRPGLIVGPMDRSDRFTYWPVRVARGGEVLAPGKPETPTQLIDVRDLAEWIIRMAEGNAGGTFNATSPAEELTIGEMLGSCKRVSGSDAAFTWVDGDFLAEQEVQAWSDMPVWVPLDGDDAGHPFINVKKAVRHGLTFRPINETVRATLKWWENEPAERKDKPMRSGLTPERENEVLKAWHEKD